MTTSHEEYLQRASREELLATIDYLETKVERLEVRIEDLEWLLDEQEI